MNHDAKKITVFAGHYGSGKTNLAVNFAINMAANGKKTALIDLDIVNPYFRSADSASALDKAGIRLISSQYANTNVEVPAMPNEAMVAFDDKEINAVFDVGGDDAGIIALGRYREKLLADGVEMLLVLNMKRPLSQDAASLCEIMRSMEKTGGIRFTGIVNNTNLAGETTPETLLSSLSCAKEISQTTGLPVVFTSVRRDLYPALDGKIENLYPIDIYHKPGWAIY